MPSQSFQCISSQCSTLYVSNQLNYPVTLLVITSHMSSINASILNIDELIIVHGLLSILVVYFHDDCKYWLRLTRVTEQCYFPRSMAKCCTTFHSLVSYTSMVIATKGIFSTSLALNFFRIGSRLPENMVFFSNRYIARFQLFAMIS